MEKRTTCPRALAPRKANAAYDLANALVRTGKLTDDEATQIWQA